MKTWGKIATAVVAAPVVAAGVYHLATPGQGSFAMKLATKVVQARGKPLADVATFRRQIAERVAPQPAPVPTKVTDGFTVRDERVGTMRVFTLVPKAGASRWTIVYLHGGAYVNDLSAPHWDIIGALAAATGATIVVPIYPLAPEHTNRDAFPPLEQLYRDVIAKTAPTNVVLAGDSAGAGLALGLTIEARDKRLPLPARLELFSPWLDLTLTDPAARAVEPFDIMLGIDALRLCGQWWAAGDDPRTPRLSPLYADLKGLPPIDIFQGTRDLFVVDARSFAAKARRVGTAIQYREYPGAFHVFVGATFAPEAKDVFRRVGIALPAQER